MKRSIEIVLVTVLLAIGNGSAVSLNNATIEVRKAIDAGNRKYIDAFGKLDGAALAAVYDEDGVRLGEKGSYARGRSAIASNVNVLMKAVTGPVIVTIETQDLWIVDDRAYETGKYSYSFTIRGKKKSRHIGGHYVTVWKRQKASDWRIVADMGVPND
jgi:uncharacterized protein (TIGR02246 family)